MLRMFWEHSFTAVKSSATVVAEPVSLSADLVHRFWPMMLVASVTSHSSSISCRSASVHLCCSPVLAFHHLTLREFAGEHCCRKPHIYHAERQQTMHYSMPFRALLQRRILLLQEICLPQEIFIRYNAAFVQCSASGRMMRK